MGPATLNYKDINATYSGCLGPFWLPRVVVTLTAAESDKQLGSIWGAAIANQSNEQMIPEQSLPQLKMFPQPASKYESFVMNWLRHSITQTVYSFMKRAQLWCCPHRNKRPVSKSTHVKHRPPPRPSPSWEMFQCLKNEHQDSCGTTNVKCPVQLLQQRNATFCTGMIFCDCIDARGSMVLQAASSDVGVLQCPWAFPH